MTPMDLQSRLRELTTMYGITRVVMSPLDLEYVLNRIVEAAIFLTDAEEGFIMLVDEETGELYLRAGKGLEDKASKGMRLRVTDSIAGQVIRTGKPIRVGGHQADQRYKLKTGFLVKSMVLVPVKLEDRVFGVLSVDHSVESMRTFSDHDETLLAELAMYTAVAMESSRLHEQTIERASDIERELKDAGLELPIPTEEEHRRSLGKFAQGLQAQREQVRQEIEKSLELSEQLRGQAEEAHKMAHRMAVWDEEVNSLLPQLSWLSKVKEQSSNATPTPAPIPSPPKSRSLFDELLINHLREGVLVCDTNGRIRSANHSASEMLGIPLNRLRRLELRGLSNDMHWERIVGSLQLAVTKGTPGDTHRTIPEATIYVKNRAIHVKLLPLVEPGGQVQEVVAILSDVAAEVEGWKARDEAVKSLSRQLRTPMTTIATFADILLDKSFDPEEETKRNYLQRMRRGVARMEDLLDEASKSEPRHTQEPAPTTVNEAIGEAITIAGEALSLSGVTLLVEVQADLPPVVMEVESIVKVVYDLLMIAGQRTAVGDSVQVDAYVPNGDGRANLLIVSIVDGGTSQGLPQLDKDESFLQVNEIVEEKGGRIWSEQQANGQGMMKLLIPMTNENALL